MAVHHTVHVPLWDERVKEFVTVPVDLVLDIYAIGRTLGRRASGSKHGKATAMHGAIKAYVQPKEKTT